MYKGFSRTQEIFYTKDRLGCPIKTNIKKKIIAPQKN